VSVADDYLRQAVAATVASRPEDPSGPTDPLVLDPRPLIEAGRLHSCSSIATHCSAAGTRGFSAHMLEHVVTDAVARALAERGDPLELTRLWRSALAAAERRVGPGGWPSRPGQTERLVFSGESLGCCVLYLCLEPAPPGATEGREGRPARHGRPWVALALEDEPFPPGVKT